MTPHETKRIYEQACRTKRITPQDDEGRAWHRVLRGYEVRDVETALDGWWADTTPSHDGQPRGKWLPTPAELKPLVEKAQSKRVSAAREPQDFLAWECSGCHYTCTGFVARSAPVPEGRACPCCRASLNLRVREAA